MYLVGVYNLYKLYDKIFGLPYEENLRELYNQKYDRELNASIYFLENPVA